MTPHSNDLIVSPLPGVRVPALLRQVCDSQEAEEALRTIWRLPKVELHLHLEGAIRPTTVSSLARSHEPSSPLCFEDWAESYWSFRDLATFVQQFREVLRVSLRGPDDYYRIARECFEDLAAQNVAYAEPSFGLRAPGQTNYVPLGEALAAIDQARREVEEESPTRIGLILALSRNHLLTAGERVDEQTCRWVQEVAEARDRGAGIVGLDLHGDEMSLADVASFAPAYQLAAEARLGLRAHAGEGTSAANVWECIRRLGVQRIGHGVSAVEDPNLVAHLVEKGIVLDICPTSNVRLAATASLEAHPIRNLMDAGVTVTVSSDDPTPFDTTVTSELALLHLRLGFPVSALRQLTLDAAAHCFQSEPDRASLLGRVREGWLE